MVPPRDNLQKYIRAGADMVIIRAGKGLRGPQGAGLLFGRKDLIHGASANCSPNQFLGRGMKVSKEEIIGFITALEIFVSEDEDKETQQLHNKAQKIVDALVEIPGITVAVQQDEHDFLTPTTTIRFDKSWRGRARNDILQSLEHGNPPIYLQANFLPEDAVAVDPFNVDDDELDPLIKRLREELLRTVN